MNNFEIIESKKKIPSGLLKTYLNDSNIYEIGIDEVGRGPLFGRVYTAAVILPKDDDVFDHSMMKDSKKFHSKKKIQEVSDYIKKYAISWSINYEDETIIDKINILQATQKSMHKCIDQIINQNQSLLHQDSIQLLIDGNYFNPYMVYNRDKKKIEYINHMCIEQGDNKYSCIAAASILAKVARDTYIEELCINHPELIEYYNIDNNKGYGAKKHLDGIKEHGITQWHRKTFGICKKY